MTHLKQKNPERRDQLLDLLEKLGLLEELGLLPRNS